ncbi:MAG TPA: polysaccharide deacetylase family protein [Myxococcales bacterium]|nr:polysaccharide deacetylase family protein [Myxococcales bacterium]
MLTTVRSSSIGRHARAVNYHDISSTMLDRFEDQLKYYQKHYVDMDRLKLNALLEGRWEIDRPGLLMTFDDGLRSHAAHVAPLLEKYGFTGWFFVPSQFVDTPDAEQWTFANEHAIEPFGDDYLGDRIALSSDEVRDLDTRGHVIGSHTRHHVRLESKLRKKELERRDHRLQAPTRGTT